MMDLLPEKCAVMFRNHGKFVFVCYYCCKSVPLADIVSHVENEHSPVADFLLQIKEEEISSEYSLVCDEIPPNQLPAIDWRKAMEDHDYAAIPDSKDHIFQSTEAPPTTTTTTTEIDQQNTINHTNVLPENNYTEDCNVLQCGICHIYLDTIYELKHHLIHQHSNGGTIAEPYKCSICDKKYAKSRNYLMHLNRLHNLTTSLKPKKYFYCDTCGKEFDKKSKLKYHLLNHVNEKQYNCLTCAIGFENSHQFYCHIQRIHRNISDKIIYNTQSQSIKYNCTKCNMIFKHSITRRKHFQQLHADPNTYVCEVCLTVFITLRAFRWHKKKQHNDADKEFKCRYCPKSFFLSSNRSYHTTTHHLNPKQLYICDYCGKEFNNRQLARHHIVNYHSGKLFKCKYCKTYETTVKTNIEYHVKSKHPSERILEEQISAELRMKKWEKSKLNRLHDKNIKLETHIENVDSDNKIYQCAKCNRFYSTNFNLEKHIKNVHSEKLFKCSQCIKSFGCSAYLHQHIIGCHSDKTFKCNQCDFITKTKRILTTHCRKIHSNELRYACETI